MNYHALQLGIAMVHQELNNFPDMTVAENIFAGREPSTFGVLNRRKMNAMAHSVLSDFRLTTDADKPMRELSISEMQLVEIAKAVSCNADLLIMDEPTSAISSNDARFLFGVLERLKESGVSVIYISHKMDEVFRISDRITVLRDGKWISTNQSDKITWGGLITSMVGRELKELFPQRNITIGEPVLQVEKLSRRKAFTDISFTAQTGRNTGCGRTCRIRKNGNTGIGFWVYPCRLRPKFRYAGKELKSNHRMMRSDTGLPW